MNEVTRLLRSVADGDREAIHGLMPLVYSELHRLAQRSMQGQHADHTLQPTALLHEAWIRLVETPHPDWEGRRHFLRVAARAMRSVLVDHARARLAAKRGGGERTLSLDAGQIPADDHRSVIELHDALNRLHELDPVLAKVVELRFFGGLTVAETADVLDVSTRTVKRGWRTAKAFLRREFSAEVRPEP